MADLAKYVVKLEANTAAYVKKLDDANRQLKRFHGEQTRSLDGIASGFRRLVGLATTGFFARYITKAAEASAQGQEFVKQVAALKAISAEAAVSLAAGLAPALGAVAAGAAEFSKQSALLSGAGQVAGEIFKVLAAGVITLVSAFKQVVTWSSATWQTWKDLFSLDFEGFSNTVEKFNNDILQINTATADALSKVFGDGKAGDFTGQIAKVTESIEKQISALKLQTELLGTTAREGAVYKLWLEGATKEQIAAADSALKQIEIYDQLGGVLDRVTKEYTEAAKATAAFRKFNDEMTLAINQSSQAMANARGPQGTETVAFIGKEIEQAMANNAALWGSMVGQAEMATSEMSVFAEQAARNMQTAFADFLFDPFEDGIKGLLSNFLDAIRRMVAEAAAAKIFEAIGGGLAGSSNPILKGLGSFFGGARAEGGPVSSGTTYLVGERGPEFFTPSASGRITPGGGLSIVQHVTVNGGASRAEVLSAMTIAKDQAKAEIRNERRRGR